MYYKVTDGAVYQFVNTDDPSSNKTYKRLMNGNTGYMVVVDDNGKPKEFTENQVNKMIEDVRTAANKRKLKGTVAINRQIRDED